MSLETIKKRIARWGNHKEVNYILKKDALEIVEDAVAELRESLKKIELEHPESYHLRGDYYQIKKVLGK